MRWGLHKDQLLKKRKKEREELGEGHNVLEDGDISMYPSILFSCCCGLVTKPCLTLCDPMDCSSPGSSVHGTLQARILEWVAISSFRGSSQPRDQTHVS